MRGPFSVRSSTQPGNMYQCAHTTRREKRAPVASPFLGGMLKLGRRCYQDACACVCRTCISAEENHTMHWSSQAVQVHLWLCE